jgi:ABC-type branched-chain amino acid transport systems, ATPase component
VPAQALFGVELHVGQGECVALMGRNGMGKTTTMRSICRLTPSSGTLRFAGHDLTALPPHRAARLGLGLLPEGRRCFPNLTVADNLSVAARPGPWDAARGEAPGPRLAERRRQKAATLSGGQQENIAIGRKLTTNPVLLLLDKATEGLEPTIRADIRVAIARLTAPDGLSHGHPHQVAAPS